MDLNSSSSSTNKTMHPKKSKERTTHNHHDNGKFVAVPVETEKKNDDNDDGIEGLVEGRNHHDHHYYSSSMLQTAAHDAVEAWHAEEKMRNGILNSRVCKYCVSSIEAADRRFIGNNNEKRYLIGLAAGLFIATKFPGLHYHATTLSTSSSSLPK